jgi:hypothetical protein
MSRSRILGRLLKLRETGAPLPSPIPPSPTIHDRRERFRIEAEKVGTVVLEGRAIDRALTLILAEVGATRICWLGMDLFSKHHIPSLVDGPAETSGRTLLFSDHPDRKVDLPVRLRAEPYDLESLAEVAVSLGTAEWGISETGSTVESATRGGGRVGAILAPVHVALLREADLVGDHVELFSRVNLGAAESARILMTGPSRTADIEKILILGVHGPKRLYVVFTD